MNMVGHNIIRARKRNGLSQEQLAQTLYVTRQTVSSWETGRTAPDVETLTRIAVALNADVLELIYGYLPKQDTRPARMARGFRLGALCCALAFVLLMGFGAYAQLRGYRVTAPYREHWGDSISTEQVPELSEAMERAAVWWNRKALAAGIAMSGLPIATLIGLCLWIFGGAELRPWEPPAALAITLGAGGVAILPFCALGDFFFWNYYSEWVLSAGYAEVVLLVGLAVFGGKWLLGRKRPAGG